MTIDPRIVRAFEADNGFALEPHLIVLSLMGSHSHGTYMPMDVHLRVLGLKNGT